MGSVGSALFSVADLFLGVVMGVRRQSTGRLPSATAVFFLRRPGAARRLKRFESADRFAGRSLPAVGLGGEMSVYSEALLFRPKVDLN
jgi:hypothetical protein